MVSYIALCAKLGAKLPGTPTIPTQIERNRDPYFDALEAADDATTDPNDPQIDAMETLLRDLLSHQLLGVVAEGAGMTVDDMLKPRDA